MQVHPIIIAAIINVEILKRMSVEDKKTALGLMKTSLNPIREARLFALLNKLLESKDVEIPRPLIDDMHVSFFSEWLGKNFPRIDKEIAGIMVAGISIDNLSKKLEKEFGEKIDVEMPNAVEVQKMYTEFTRRKFIPGFRPKAKQTLVESNPTVGMSDRKDSIYTSRITTFSSPFKEVVDPDNLDETIKLKVMHRFTLRSRL